MSDPDRADESSTEPLRAESAPQLIAGRLSAAGRLGAWVQLVRLPNLFTAVADSWAGYLAAQGLGWMIDPTELALLGFGSVGFYGAGVVFNDVADLPRDRRTRPERPLPSGAIAVRTAAAVGAACLLVGVGAAVTLGVLGGRLLPAAIGCVLAGCVLGYDFVVKSTPLGPTLMGLCRGLNLLLGMSVGIPSARMPAATHLWAALSLTVYVMGLTVFARREEASPRRGDLAIGTAFMGAALAILATLPMIPSGNISFAHLEWRGWLTLVGVVGLILGHRLARAISLPDPITVQQAVKQCILWIIVWDATLCFAFAGGVAAGLVVLLLIPAVVAAVWIKPT